MSCAWQRRFRLSALAGAASASLALFVAGATGAGARDPSFAPSGVLSPSSWIGAVGDFNGDRKPDLAVVNGRTIGALLGDGAGRFTAAPGVAAKAGAFPVAVATGDFNGDAKTDVAVSNGEVLENGLDVVVEPRVSVLLGNGAGAFSAAPGSPLKAGGALVVADFNGDGRDDLIAGGVVLLADASGRFTSPAKSSAGGTVLAAADLNGDGKPDLAVGAGKKISIRLGDGAGGFRAGPGSPIGLGGSTAVAAIGDFNRDGKIDLAVATDTITILFGNGSGGFRPAPGSPVKLGAYSLAAADFNGDRKLDLAVEITGFDDVITLLFGDGKGGFHRAARPFAAESAGGILAAADLNGDGKVDLVTHGRILFQAVATPAVAHDVRLPGSADRIFSTSGVITNLAADDNRVAVATRVKGSCGRVVVWTAPGRNSTSFPTTVGCGDADIDVTELALGGGQVAWIGFSEGNYSYDSVYAAQLSGGKPRQIDSTVGDHNGSGHWAGHLLGGGPLLAYNRWSVCDLESDSHLSCSFGAELVRIAAARRVVIIGRGVGSYALSAVGTGRAAVASAGAVSVLKSSGSRVANVPVSAVPPHAVAFGGTQLAVAETLTLDLYDAATGKKTKSLRLGPAAALGLGGVDSKLALLRGPRSLALMRLSDGKLISLSPSAATALVDARLTEAGLFYAYNTPKAVMKGHIVFEPAAKLLARF